ncbi:EamA family transporter [Candidatus Woesearchaeota archaeon]|nr:EamA family transporter [Candidatus Woesearchaeota archaeon]
MVILCTLITSFAQLLLKLGVDKFEPSFVGIITNSFLILGLLLYVGGAIIFVLALKHGDLSIIYPFISLSFIWVALLSLIFLGESIVLLQWLGIVIIIAGVSFIGWGAKSA